MGNIIIPSVMTMLRLRGLLVLPCLMATAIVGTVHFIFPAAVAFLFALQDRKRYRAIVDAVEWAWLTGAAALIELVAGVRIHTSGDVTPVPSDRAVLIVLNHHCRLDWMFFWCVAARLQLLRGGAFKIVLKEGLRNAPFFGWATQAFLFLFLKRNDRDGDLAALQGGIEHCVHHDDRYALLLFPEGTDLSKSNVEKDAAYAGTRGLATYRHVLHPRAPPAFQPPRPPMRRRTARARQTGEGRKATGEATG
jgi:lysocardiolipin and lysophospholipid acyltransferase